MVKEILIILAFALILLSACKGPDCNVDCKGHECACEVKKDVEDTKDAEDAVDVPKDATETGWRSEFVPAFEWRELNA